MMRIASVLATSCLLAMGCAVQAQPKPVVYKYNCLLPAPATPEPASANSGHMVVAANFTCRVEGGPLDGAIMTGSQVYEFKGADGVGVAGYGVVRQPGAMAVYVNEQMKNTLTLTDGKITGFAASGRGRFSMATGSAAPMSGKSYTYETRPTGPASMVIEVTVL